MKSAQQFGLTINIDEYSATNKLEFCYPADQPKPLCPPKDL